MQYNGMISSLRGIISKVSDGVQKAAEHMSMYIASDPDSYVKAGKAVGSGQCVALVQKATGAPPTSQWIKGPDVWGNATIPVGTAIATFINGKYPSMSSGNHAAIYMGQDKDGIHVIDQWLGHKPSKRTISIKSKSSNIVNHPENYSVVLSDKMHGPKK
ncbi:BPSL0067 family protein [Azospirillum sp. B2RO_4]|uniref:BPSL0067 family protein n=1 Tax=Azospirillum sp. B2RO_4 TaxID=3027796 RepID=UPI003DA81118